MYECYYRVCVMQNTLLYTTCHAGTGEAALLYTYFFMLYTYDHIQ